MVEIKKILVCIDLSEYSPMTMAYALEMHRKTGARMVVISVINQRDISNIEMIGQHCPGIVDVAAMIRNMKDERLKDLHKFIRENCFEEKSQVSIEIKTGLPYECILDAAEEHHADLIVMANKGRGNFYRVLFGSAAEKVFRHAKVPVLSVRDPERFKRRSGLLQE